jgi:hypothetical protein
MEWQRSKLVFGIYPAPVSVELTPLLRRLLVLGRVSTSRPGHPDFNLYSLSYIVDNWYPYLPSNTTYTI